MSRDCISTDDGLETDCDIVIAKNALQQEESEEFTGGYDDPIDINIHDKNQGCAC